MRQEIVRLGRAKVISAPIVMVVCLFVGLAGAAGTPHASRQLRCISASFPDYLDPALSYTLEGWTGMYNTYIPLLTYQHAGGRAGAEVIPGLARDLPRVTDGGKTYTLFLRGGLEYSNGERVRASDFEFAVKRMFMLNSGGTVFYTDIVGAKRFLRARRGDISGIRANNKTGKITIRLIRPRGTFTNELALMFVAPVPPSTPMWDQSFKPPSGTGPYAIDSSKPGRGWSYVRNPEWGRRNSRLMPQLPSGHVGRIQVEIVRNASAQVAGVKSGRFQCMLIPSASTRLVEMMRRYQGSQFRVEPMISTYYFWLNTTRRPFNDLRVRQAVNYAVDPAALERIYGGELSASHQILPEGLPGHEEFDLYPYDPAKAKAMIEEAHPSDRNITVWTDTESPNQEAGEYYATVLRALGFKTKLKIVNADYYFTIIGNRNTADLDTGWSNWFEDYPHPNDFFQPLLSGKSILRTYNGNFANLDVPALDEKISRLRRESLGPEQEAAYAALDRKFMELAPWVPYGTRMFPLFVSKAIDLEKVIWNPTFGVDLTSFQFKN